jgi:hypothetical protein
LRCIPCMHTLRMPMESACLSCWEVNSTAQFPIVGSHGGIIFFSLQYRQLVWTSVQTSASFRWVSVVWGCIG